MISDYVTNQNIVPPTVIVPTSGTIASPARVFALGNYFIIVFGTSTNHLQYIAVPISNPSAPLAAVDLTSQYSQIGNQSFDGFVVGIYLYLAWNGTDGGGAVRVSKLDKNLNQYATISYATFTGSLFSVFADVSSNNPIIYVAFYNATQGYILAVNDILAPVLAPTHFIIGETILNLTGVAQDQVATIFYEIPNNYGYDSAIPTHYIKKNTVTQSGTVGTSSILVRSVGLASKAFIVDGIEYFLAVYQSVFQPTYFLINYLGQVIAKLAYSNAGGYLTHGLPSAVTNDQLVSIAYLFKDLIQSVNKTQGLANAAGIYSQTGVNLVTFTINNMFMDSSEIGNNLNISGGFLWAYDGILPNEQNFFLWPDNVEVTTATGGGGLIAQTYFYQALYEWTDSQGNIFRSAPSIPVSVVTTTATSTNTIYVPTIRLTYKIASPVKIVLYRWSTAQQNYYQVTSVTMPTLNSTTVDYVTIVDAQSDSAILGNSLIYTTGGVIENIGPPATEAMTLFDTRLWLVDAEDKNLLWYSKQIIEGTPVEMSDLFTLFVAPSTSTQGTTGPIRAVAPMDDKLIIFKEDALFYINGAGPDNTGANSQYSQPIFITSTVGSVNQNSIVFTPSGLMFQSDKGIWILSRDLQTSYIGAPVEQFNSSLVQSAVNIPETNQVRFTLDTGQMLMYDYYFGQWGTFVGVPAISSTIYQLMHTFINKYGVVYQETPNKYLDGSNPVLLSFTTSWFNLTGLQGYQRAYFFYLLGVYYSPHKLNLQIAYDYNPSPTQSTLISPTNYTPAYGISSPYGEGNYGGPGNIEQWRVFLSTQRCQAFQITLDEVFDPSFGASTGQGLTLSGINLIYGSKKQFFPASNAQSAGK